MVLTTCSPPTAKEPQASVGGSSRPCSVSALAKSQVTPPAFCAVQASTSPFHLILKFYFIFSLRWSSGALVVAFTWSSQSGRLSFFGEVAKVESSRPTNISWVTVWDQSCTPHIYSICGLFWQLKWIGCLTEKALVGMGQSSSWCRYSNRVTNEEDTIQRLYT